MNYGRTILPIFVFIGMLAAVFALMSQDTGAFSPKPSISVSPAIVSSANQPISFSWGAGTVGPPYEASPNRYYYQTAYVDYAQSRWVYSPWIDLGPSAGSVTRTLADFGFTRPGMYYFSVAVRVGEFTYYYSESKQVAYPRTTITEQSPSGQPCGFTPSEITSLTLSQTNTKWVYFFTVLSGNLSAWPHTMRYAVYTPSGALSWDSGTWGLNDYCWFQNPFLFPPQTAPGTWRVDTYFDGQVVQSNSLAITSSVPAPSGVSLRIDPPPAVITLGESATFSWSATNANEYWLWNATARAWEFLGNAAGSLTRSSAGSPIGEHWFYAGAYNRPNPTFVRGSWTGLGILGHTLTKETINGSQACGYQPAAANTFQIGERVYMFSSYPQNPGTYTIRHRYYQPNGSLWRDTAITGNYCYYYSSADLSSSAQTGTWRMETLINDRLSQTQTFTVTQPPPPTAPTASITPTSVTTVESATLSWTASSGAANCNVFINNADSGAVSCGGGSQTFLGSNLGIGTHTGYVRACNTGGCVNSNIATLQVQTRRPPFLRLR